MNKPALTTIRHIGRATYETYRNNHRALWDYLAQSSDTKKHNWPGFRDGGFAHVADCNHCFACRFDEFRPFTLSPCNLCPIPWHSEGNYISSLWRSPCEQKSTIYTQWRAANTYELRSHYAAQIRDAWPTWEELFAEEQQNG